MRVHPGIFVQSAQTIEKQEVELPEPAKERRKEQERELSLGEGVGIPTLGQSRWLSKERGYERGNSDRCQTKGIGKACKIINVNKYLLGNSFELVTGNISNGTLIVSLGPRFRISGNNENGERKQTELMNVIFEL